MNKTIIRYLLRFLMLTMAGVFASADDARLIRYFSKNGIPPLDTREQVIAGIMTEFPAAIQLFEFQDELQTVILFKLSERSFGIQTWGGGYREAIFDAKSIRQILTQTVRKVTGSFVEQITPDERRTYTWAIKEEALDLKDATKLFFSYLLMGGEDPKGSTDKKVCIAVDWPSGRVEGVKVTPKGEEKGLSP
jgi:hypothetical protein